MHDIVTWCQESKVKVTEEVISQKTQSKMAEQIMAEAIAKAVAEATRIVIQTMANSQAQRVPNSAGPKLGGPTLKQPNLNWEVPDKYTK